MLRRYKSVADGASPLVSSALQRAALALTLALMAAILVSAPANAADDPPPGCLLDEGQLYTSRDGGNCLNQEELDAVPSYRGDDGVVNTYPEVRRVVEDADTEPELDVMLNEVLTPPEATTVVDDGLTPTTTEAMVIEAPAYDGPGGLAEVARKGRVIARKSGPYGKRLVQRGSVRVRRGVARAAGFAYLSRKFVCQGRSNVGIRIWQYNSHWNWSINTGPFTVRSAKHWEFPEGLAIGWHYNGDSYLWPGGRIGTFWVGRATQAHFQLRAGPWVIANRYPIHDVHVHGNGGWWHSC